MPKLRPKTKELRAAKLTKDYSESGFNQTRLAKKRGVTSQNINQLLGKEPAQKALSDQIAKAAKKAGINITWLLRKYKTGADKASKVIGYLHQYKKDESGKVEQIKPDEVVSNEFIDAPDWNVQRLYLHDIAEIMKWIKQNGNNEKGGVHIHLTVEQRNARTDRLQEFYQN